MIKAHEAEQVSQADDLLAQVQNLQARAMAILDRAERSGDLRAALAAIREARGGVELLGRLSEQLIERQRLEISGPGGKPIDFSTMSIDELETIARGGR